MAALTANPDYKMLKPDMPSMQVPAIKSGLLHIGVIAALTVGIPFVAKEPMDISPAISVEIIDVSDLTTTPKVAPPQEKPKEEKPPEPVQKQESAPKMTEQKPPDLNKPSPPDVETVEKVEDVPPPEPIERKPIKKPDPPKPEVTKKVEPKKPEVKKEEVKKEEPKQEDQMKSLLNNLLDSPDSNKSEEKPLDPEAEPDSGEIAKLSDQLSMSEMDAVRRQIGQCWNVMAGAKYAEELIVEVRVTMNRDRTVNSASILDRGRYNRETHFRAAADAAIRALQNPRCSPLKLPPEKYDQWKSFIFRFDPSDVL